MIWHGHAWCMGFCFIGKDMLCMMGFSFRKDSLASARSGLLMDFARVRLDLAWQYRIFADLFCVVRVLFLQLY